jgi:pimeloyl-ACP methyl ester carboxylesterase
MRTVRLSISLMLLLSVSLTGLLVFQPTGRFDAQASSPRFSEGPCPFTLSSSSGQVEGQTYRCGTVVVPEDHRSSTGKTISLAVAVFKASASKPNADPIIYLEGGPGGFTLDQVDFYFRSFRSLLATRDLILFDQRGTGHSVPSLYCPELTALYYQLLGEVITPEASAKHQTETTLVCRQRLVQEGVNLSVYNTAQNAADVESIRQALGYQTLNLYGISYGTRLALTVMRDFPKSVRSTVIDSVVPLEIDLIADYIPNTERVFKQLWDACANDTACNNAYPDLETVFYQTVDELNRNPAQVTATSSEDGTDYNVVVDGNALIEFLFDSFYVTSIIPSLPALIYGAHNGQVDTIASLLVAFADENKTISYGMYFSADCPEEVAFTTPDLVKAAAQGDPEQLVASEMPSSVGEFDICKAWGTGKAPAIENEPVKSDIPTLVIAGSFDPVTPPSYSKRVADELSKSYYFEIPNSGHGASLSGRCPFSLVVDFFDQPTSQPDGSCVKTIGPPRFVVKP